ncbi:MAG: hypothetical protein ACJ76B_11055 [Solirubrobacterales bacterium]
MTGLFAALVAFGAFALVPAISSAHGLTDTSGGATTTVAVGSKIAGYNEPASTVKFNAGPLVVECNETTLLGKVHANPHTAGGAVLGTIEDAFFRGNQVETKCKSSIDNNKGTVITVPALTQAGGTGNFSHWCIKTLPETDEFEVEPRNCTLNPPTGGEFTFLLFANGVECGYTRTANLKGKFTTTAGAHTAGTLSLNKEQTLTKHKGGILCPPSGALEEFNFELFTDTAGTTPGTFRDAKNIADPIWIQ